MRRVPAFVVSLLFSGLSACVSTPASAPRPDAADADTPDPWALTIEAERWTVLIERATQGAAPDGMGLGDGPLADRARIDAALKHGVRQMYVLRATVCSLDLIATDECGPLPAPAWLGEPVGAIAPLDELARRSDWLAETAAPFIEAGCRAGEDRSAEPLFCSVE